MHQNVHVMYNTTNMKGDFPVKANYGIQQQGQEWSRHSVYCYLPFRHEHGWIWYNSHSASGHSSCQIIPRFYTGNSGSYTVKNLPFTVISHHHLCAIKMTCTVAEVIPASPLQACCPQTRDTSHLLPDLPVSSNIMSFSQLQNFTLFSSCSSLYIP